MEIVREPESAVVRLWALAADVIVLISETHIL